MLSDVFGVIYFFTASNQVVREALPLSANHSQFNIMPLTALVDNLLVSLDIVRKSPNITRTPKIRITEWLTTYLSA